jgi:hypothetical protein
LLEREDPRVAADFDHLATMKDRAALCGAGEERGVMAMPQWLERALSTQVTD